MEIYADDVKCSHGSTSGNIDDEFIYYLMTRGLSKKDAILLLTEAFLFEVTNSIDNQETKKFVERHLKIKFMNIKSIKSEFPILKKVNNKSLIYLDSANSSQKPKSVINSITNFYENDYSNIGRSVHTLAVKATNKFEQTRDNVQKYLNAKYREEIIFTKGATEAINLVASSFGDEIINTGDEIILTELEHHSNYVPWHYLRKNKGAILKFAQVNNRLEIDVDEIKKLITKKTKLIAITHVSNVTGGVTPLKKIVDLANSKNIPVLVDGTQGAPHLDLNMQDLGCDFYAISCHKMYGPNGLGILYAKKMA